MTKATAGNPGPGAYARTGRDSPPLTVQPAVTPPPKRRLHCLDQARALAILAMIWAHLGVGVLNRLAVPEPWDDLLMYVGRFATPAFIVIFGLTVGFVYFERFRLGARRDITARFLRRAGWLALAAAVISAPQLLDLIRHADFRPRPWLIESYSILTYYTLALLSMGLWLRWIAPRPYRRSVITGVLLWTAGTMLAFRLWLFSGETLLEGFRLHLVSGSYGYLQLTGTALLALPCGLWLRRCFERHQTDAALRRLASIGLALWLAGIAWGAAVGEFSLANIASGSVKGPPRAWYFLHFGGLTLLVLAALHAAASASRLVHAALYPLALLGQCALTLYVGHKVILMLGHPIERLLGLSDLAHGLAVLIATVALAGIAIGHRHVTTPKRHTAAAT